MWSTIVVVTIMQGPPVRRGYLDRWQVYSLENDGTEAGDVVQSGTNRFYWFEWPNSSGGWTKQRVLIPDWWRKGEILPKPPIPGSVIREYGSVYFVEPETEEPESEPRSDLPNIVLLPSSNP